MGICWNIVTHGRLLLYKRAGHKHRSTGNRWGKTVFQPTADGYEQKLKPLNGRISAPCYPIRTIRPRIDRARRDAGFEPGPGSPNHDPYSKNPRTQQNFVKLDFPLNKKQNKIEQMTFQKQEMLEKTQEPLEIRGAHFSGTLSAVPAAVGNSNRVFGNRPCPGPCRLLQVAATFCQGPEKVFFPIGSR